MDEIDAEGRSIAEVKPLTGIRAVIAEKMTKSIRDYPQGSALFSADMSNLIAFREDLKSKGVKVSFGDLFVKATACALEENMEINGARLGDKLYYYNSINIGMMATINGCLIEPVITEVQNKTIEEVALELAKDYENLRKGKLMRVKLEGATFSVSNLGMFDIDNFTPLLSPPVGGILGISSTKKTPVVNEAGEIVVIPQINLAITTDHGLVDGISVVNFIKSLKTVLATPNDYMCHKRDSE
jgi:pyruvate dehydrogenase E2 component (dihydrolipoamide acetyltransferase)